MSVTVPGTEPTMRMPLSDLVRELVQKTQELFVKQVELTKAELKVEGRKLAKISVFAVVALHLSVMSVLLLAISLILLLGQAIGIVWATVVTMLIFLIGTGIVLGMIVNEAQHAFPPIEEE